MSINGKLNTDVELAGLLTRKQPIVIPSAPKCAKCTKSVYKAEETRGANQIFHKLCFKCAACNKLLEPNIVTEHQNDLYCRSCYGKNFGPKGYGYGCGAGTLSTECGTIPINTNGSDAASGKENDASLLKRVNSQGLTSSFSSSSLSSSPSSNSIARKPSVNLSILNLGNTEKCARCQKAVYMAEKVAAAGQSYHKLCFTCLSCKKLLNSMTCCDNSDGDIFCKPCYGKQYGPRGVGYGIGAGTLKTS